MTVLSVKRKEFSQAIQSLVGFIRDEKGCRRCDFCRSMENENELLLLEEWDIQENFERYQNSEHFMIRRGAMNLLKEPEKVTIHIEQKRKNMETELNRISA